MDSKTTKFNLKTLTNRIRKAIEEKSPEGHYLHQEIETLAHNLWTGSEYENFFSKQVMIAYFEAVILLADLLPGTKII